MPFHQPHQVRYLTFDSFAENGLTHAVFTRIGGESRGYLSSLNVGLTVGDDPEIVARNRQLAFKTLNRQINTLSDSWLVHRDNLVIYDTPRPPDQKIPPKADIILTDNPAVSLFMRYADCVPILLYDPEHHAIGLAHAGWKGTVMKVAKTAVEAMGTRYGTRPANLLTAIGPSIGPDRYQVGPEVVEQVKQAFNSEAPSLLPKFGDSTHFDLWAANRLTLIQAGVRQIEEAEICTASNTQDWFSHRAEQGKTGRFGVLLALKD
ncbi:MAG: peptidoglycan editing factor PgeF [Anaerolineales bacterium]